jgi:hypothetical protein
MKQLGIVLVFGLGVGVGCAAGTAVQTQVAQAQAPAGVQKWDYQCLSLRPGRDVDMELTRRGHTLGGMGWELVSVSGDATGTMACFKRPLP